METKHTPGPWVVSVGMRAISVIAGSFRFVIGNNSEAEANARLIAAAPELLEALRWFMPFIESEQDDERQAPWVEKARAAIAKATKGE